MTKTLQITALLTFIAFGVCCSKNSTPADAAGRLFVKVGFENFCITIKEGNADIGNFRSPELVYKQRSSSNIIEYKMHSFSDNHKKIAYVDNESKIRVLDLQKKTDVMIDKSPYGSCLPPVISPNGSYVAFARYQEEGNTIPNGNYVIHIIKLEDGEFNEVPFNNELSGFKILSPGVIHWLNDSSGFTYTKTKSANKQIVPEVCQYDVSTRNIRVLGNGIGGVLSPDHGKLLYMPSENRKTLEVIDLKDCKRNIFAWNRGIIDYTWSPDGSFAAILVQGVLQGKIVIADPELKRLRTIDTRQDLMNWDAYIVPIRWLPLEGG